MQEALQASFFFFLYKMFVMQEALQASFFFLEENMYLLRR